MLVLSQMLVDLEIARNKRELRAVNGTDLAPLGRKMKPIRMLSEFLLLGEPVYQCINGKQRRGRKLERLKLIDIYN